MASGPDNDGTYRYCQTVRVRQARQDGAREEPVLTPLKSATSSNLADQGWIAARTRLAMRRGTPGPVDVVGREAMGKVCGVLVARPQGHSRAPSLSIDSEVNVGTAWLPPAPLASRVSDGKVRRPPTASRGDGAAVVLRAGESPVRGEGRQRIRSGSTGRPGARR